MAYPPAPLSTGVRSRNFKIWTNIHSRAGNTGLVEEPNSIDLTSSYTRNLYQRAKNLSLPVILYVGVRAMYLMLVCLLKRRLAKAPLCCRNPHMTEILRRSS